MIYDFFSGLSEKRPLMKRMMVAWNYHRWKKSKFFYETEKVGSDAL
jgi:hypothetical protein